MDELYSQWYNKLVGIYNGSMPTTEANINVAQRI